jgi:hypothetical protein
VAFGDSDGMVHILHANFKTSVRAAPRERSRDAAQWWGADRPPARSPRRPVRLARSATHATCRGGTELTPARAAQRFAAYDGGAVHQLWQVAHRDVLVTVGDDEGADSAYLVKLWSLERRDHQVRKVPDDGTDASAHGRLWWETGVSSLNGVRFQGRPTCLQRFQAFGSPQVRMLSWRNHCVRMLSRRNHCVRMLSRRNHCVRMLSWRNHWVRMLRWRNHWVRTLS